MSKSETRCTLGIIGCGKVAEEYHLPTLKRLGIRPVAVADSDLKRARHIAAKFAIPAHFSSATKMLVSTHLDAVAVLTSTPSHYELGKAVLEAGKHLFIEKPLALSADECNKLVVLAARSELTAMVCFNFRFYRQIKRAREAILSGSLGEIRAVHSLYTHNRDGRKAPDWHRNVSTGGGVTFNESVHHIDLWRYLTGQDIMEVSCFNRPSEHYEDETSVIIARLTDSTLCTLTSTFRSSPAFTLELLGTKGRLALDLYNADGFLFYPYNTYSGALMHRLKRILVSVVEIAGSVRSISKGGSYPESFYSAWSHFIDSVGRNTPSECSLEDGSQAVRVARSALQSVVEGTPARLS